jgi:BASS family bile acid:Na+ symporter
LVRLASAAAAGWPGGVLSKVFAYLGQGNLALSITLTVPGTLASVVTVPLLLRVLAHGRLPDDFEIPAAAVVRDVALYLLLPLGVGMAVARLAPRGRRPFAKWCNRTGFVFVLIMVIGSLGSGRIHPGEYGWRVPLANLFCLASQQASMLPFRILGWPNPDCLAVGVEVTMRNLNLALLLKALLFPAEKGADPIADGVLFVILICAAAALCAGFVLTLNFRRMARKAAARWNRGVGRADSGGWPLSDGRRPPPAVGVGGHADDTHAEQQDTGRLRHRGRGELGVQIVGGGSVVNGPGGVLRQIAGGRTIPERVRATPHGRRGGAGERPGVGIGPTGGAEDEGQRVGHQQAPEVERGILLKQAHRRAARAEERAGVRVVAGIQTQGEGLVRPGRVFH